MMKQIDGLKSKHIKYAKKMIKRKKIAKCNLKLGESIYTRILSFKMFRAGII